MLLHVAMRCECVGCWMCWWLGVVGVGVLGGAPRLCGSCAFLDTHVFQLKGGHGACSSVCLYVWLWDTTCLWRVCEQEAGCVLGGSLGRVLESLRLAAKSQLSASAHHWLTVHIQWPAHKRTARRAKALLLRD